MKNAKDWYLLLFQTSYEELRGLASPGLSNELLKTAGISITWAFNRVVKDRSEKNSNSSQNKYCSWEFSDYEGRQGFHTFILQTSYEELQVTAIVRI